MREERIARIMWGGEVWYARPDGEDLMLLSGAPLDRLIATNRRVALKEARFMPPVPATKLIGIGANFPGEEPLGPDPHPSFFIKPPSSFTGHLATVEIPHVFGSVLAEGERLRASGRDARPP